MASETVDASTVVLAETGWRSRKATSRVEVPALTVLCHPDLGRVGERILLSELLAGREAHVSRLQPGFAAPGSMTARPLADIRLSRQPLRFQAASESGAVQVVAGGSHTRVAAGGSPIVDHRTFSAAEVDRGVVLELAGRVVLLLHRFSSSTAAGPPHRGLVGDSSAMVRVRMDVERVADLEVPVLLRGETGTGKELVARAIHETGRRQGAFVAVNLGAIPPALASSELFGTVKGAFTGASHSQTGYFARAEGGTLLLDEIGVAPAEVQVGLLRALESREIQPVGTQRPRPIDVRLLAATDVDLETAVEAGSFRGSLLHRLAGYEIWLPPLRQRRDDVARLLIHFLRLELEAVGEADRLRPPRPEDPAWLPADLVARLAEHDWPGNVRQLHNVARQLVIASRGLPCVEVSPQIERLLQPRELPVEPREPRAASRPAPAAVGRPQRRRPSAVTEEEVVETLREHRWNLKTTAQAIGISRTSLYALIEKFPGLRSPAEITGEEIARAYRECGGDHEAMVERLEISSRALGRRLKKLHLD